MFITPYDLSVSFLLLKLLNIYFVIKVINPQESRQSTNSSFSNRIAFGIVLSLF